jgi:hypothetical protein
VGCSPLGGKTQGFCERSIERMPGELKDLDWKDPRPVNRGRCAPREPMSEKGESIGVA